MHGALQHEHARIGRLYANVAEHGRIRGLLLTRSDYDSGAADPKQCHRAELESAAVIERAGADEPPVAEPLDSEARDERRFAGKSRVRAERKIQTRALPCFLGASSALRVPDHAGEHAFDVGGDERLEQ